MAALRQVLQLTVAEREDPTLPPMIDVAVQIWRGKAHVMTVKILDYGTLVFPPDFDASCVEQFASITSRIAARLLDEELFHAIRHSAVHTLHDIGKEFPEPAIAGD